MRCWIVICLICSVVVLQLNVAAAGVGNAGAKLTKQFNNVSPPPKPYVPPPPPPQPPPVKQIVPSPPTPPPAAPVGSNLQNLPKKPVQQPTPQVLQQRKTTQDKLHTDALMREAPIEPPRPIPNSVSQSAGKPAANLQDTFRANAAAHDRLKRGYSEKLSPRAKSEIGAAIRKAKQGASVGVPKIARQLQDAHIYGTPEYKRRVARGKPTSYFRDRESADSLTKEAWKKGKNVPGDTPRKDYDFGMTIGYGPNGGAQTSVRVHRGKTGIHGHPKGPERK